MILGSLCVPVFNLFYLQLYSYFRYILCSLIMEKFTNMTESRCLIFIYLLLHIIAFISYM
jgi:hypothetical protein